MEKDFCNLKSSYENNKKNRNLKRKSKPIEYSKPNKKSKNRNNVIFIDQISMHLRDRLKKIKLRKTDEVKFIKQLPLHPRDRLKIKEKKNLITMTS